MQRNFLRFEIQIFLIAYLKKEIKIKSFNVKNLTFLTKNIC